MPHTLHHNPTLLPAAHWAEIETSVAPYIDHVDLAVLGGSQVLGLATKKSDFDILIIGHHINQPVSLITNVDGQKYDLILRDPHTLAYDFAQDPAIGRGTLLHICCFGVPLLDLCGKADRLKEKATHLYRTGPAAINRESLDDRLDSLHRRIDGACAAPPAPRLVEAFMLAHDLGVTAQRAARRWVSKGKILGRFLLEHLPDIKNEIERGFPDMVAGNTVRFKNLITHKIPALYRAGHEKTVPFWIPGTPTQTPVDMAEAFTTVRTCPETIPDYLHSTLPLKRDAAHLWLRWKFENAASAVTTDRMGRSSNEYFYAVAKYTSHLMTLHSYHNGNKNGQQPVSERIAACLDDHPALAENIHRALQGNPASLLGWGQAIYDQTVPQTESGWPPRLAPAHHRLDTPFI